MRARTELEGQPAEFTRAVAQLREAPLRPEVVCEQLPAPGRIAPYAFAMSGDVVVAGDELGTGRIVLLHDPAGNDAWRGRFRLVTYARADVDPEMVDDPVLPQVGWSWLVDALHARGAEHLAPSGSVTSVRTEGFGGMAADGGSAQIEIRASWTPGDADDPGDVAPHVSAWGDLLCTVAGLPPLAPGVVAMPNRRGGVGSRR